MKLVSGRLRIYDRMTFSPHENREKRLVVLRSTYPGRKEVVIAARKIFANVLNSKKVVKNSPIEASKKKQSIISSGTLRCHLNDKRGRSRYLAIINAINTISKKKRGYFICNSRSHKVGREKRTAINNTKK